MRSCVPRALAGEHIEFVLVVAAVVLRLHRDVDAVIFDAEVCGFQALDPCDDCSAEPLAEIVFPSIVDCFHIEESNCVAENLLEMAEVDGGRAIATVGIGSDRGTCAELPLQIADDPMKRFLSWIRRRERRRRHRRERWKAYDRSHRCDDTPSRFFNSSATSPHPISSSTINTET